MSRQIFIDTDGQIDSLWGLLLAKRYLEVTGISVCIGKNAEMEHSLKNVSGFAKMAGLECPLYKGSERCVLKHEIIVGPRFLPDGKCALPVPEGNTYADIPAWDAIYQAAEAAGGDLEIACFGPMTNIALAIFKYPELPKKIKKIAFVGGSFDFGDYKRNTEINMAVDPEAARAVFQSGIRMEMYGYHLERESALTNGEIGQIVHGADGPYTTAFALCGMSHTPGAPIYYGPSLLALGLGTEDIISFERYNVFLEDAGTICKGRTTPLNMYTPIGHPKDTLVAMHIDKEKYVQILKETLESYEAL